MLPAKPVASSDKLDRRLPDGLRAERRAHTLMGGGQYIVVETANGWCVREGDSVVSAARSLDDALATAKIMAHAVKAAGGRASVRIQSAAGDLINYDLDRV